MTVDNIMSRAEKEKKVLDLYYNQSKGYDKIAKELHLSFSTINDIIKRDRQQKEKEKEKEQQTEMKSNIIDDGNGNGNGKAEQQNQIIPTTSATTSASASLSQTQLEDLSDKQKAVMAYKLYDQGKSPVQVATTLCLTAKEAMTYHREFWRLKGHYQLYQIYPEI